MNPNKTEELMEMVTKIVAKRAESPRKESFLPEDSSKKWWFRDRYNKNHDKGHCIGNFKEYRFGYEDTTLSEWMVKKRMLSIPRALKA